MKSDNGHSHCGEHNHCDHLSHLPIWEFFSFKTNLAPLIRNKLICVSISQEPFELTAHQSEAMKSDNGHSHCGEHNHCDPCHTSANLRLFSKAITTWSHSFSIIHWFENQFAIKDGQGWQVVIVMVQVTTTGTTVTLLQFTQLLLFTLSMPKVIKIKTVYHLKAQDSFEISKAVAKLGTRFQKSNSNSAISPDLLPPSSLKWVSFFVHSFVIIGSIIMQAL